MQPFWTYKLDTDKLLDSAVGAIIDALDRATDDPLIMGAADALRSYPTERGAQALVRKLLTGPSSAVATQIIMALRMHGEHAVRALYESANTGINLWRVRGTPPALFSTLIGTLTSLPLINERIVPTINLYLALKSLRVKDGDGTQVDTTFDRKALLANLGNIEGPDMPLALEFLMTVLLDDDVTIRRAAVCEIGYLIVNLRKLRAASPPLPERESIFATARSSGIAVGRNLSTMIFAFEPGDIDESGGARRVPNIPGAPRRDVTGTADTPPADSAPLLDDPGGDND